MAKKISSRVIEGKDQRKLTSAWLVVLNHA